MFGLKANAPSKEKDHLIEELAQIEGIKLATSAYFAVCENAFPNGKHIFLTRRNKVRLLVSWWKAIVSLQWHLTKRQEREPFSSELKLETTLGKARFKEFLEEGNIVPITIVYLDFVRGYEKTIRSVIAFLGITETAYPINKTYYEPLSDELLEDGSKDFDRNCKRIGII